MKFKKIIMAIFSFFMVFVLVLAVKPDLALATTQVKFVKVVFVGDYKSGKTSIWKRLMDQGFDDSERQSTTLTPGEIIRVDGSTILSLKIWDTAGLDKYYNEVIDFTTGANFVFIVHDLAKKLDDSVRQYLSKACRDASAKKAADGKIVIIGSKYDLRQADVVNSAAQARMLEEVAQVVPCACVLTSAKSEGDPGISTLIRYIIEKSREMALPDKIFSREYRIKFNADTQSQPRSSGGCVLL